jgi:hypothetical protein
MSKGKKKYWNMTTEELAEATREFDQEGIAETFRALTPEEEAAWRAAVHKRPARRTRNGRDLKVISLGIDAGLPKRADAVAKKHGISRAKLVAEGLEAVLTRKAT